MDLKKVTKTDLSASNLSRLEQELTDMASKGNAKAFKTLIKFMERIAEINQNAKLTVSKTDGSKNLKINDTETINYAETLGKIKDAIEAGFTTTPTGKAADRKKQLEEAIETTIGTMLNEDSIMNQLIRNGLDEKEYQDFMEKEKENSKAKYEEAKAKYEELAKKQEDIFGKDDYTTNDNKWWTKSDLTTLKHDQDAISKMKMVKKQLKTLKADKKSLSSLTGDELTNKENEMKEAIENIKNTIGTIKSNQIMKVNAPGEELDFSKFDNEMNNTYAKFGDLIDNADKIIGDLKENLNEHYKKISQDIAANHEEFGYANESDVISAIGDGQDKTQRKEIDKLIERQQEKINSHEKEMKIEDNYQKEVDSSLTRYQDLIKDENNLASKFNVVRDSSGNIQFIPTAAAKSEYLNKAGITDEAQFINDKALELRNAKEAEFDAKSNKEKRNLLKDDFRSDGKFHTLKTIIAYIRPGKMWNDYKESKLNEAENLGRVAAVNGVNSIVNNQADPDIKKYKDVILKKQDRREAYNNAVKEAAIQEKLLNYFFERMENNNEITDFDKSEAAEKARNAAFLGIMDYDEAKEKKENEEMRLDSQVNSGNLSLEEAEKQIDALIDTINDKRVEREDKAFEPLEESDKAPELEDEGR